jgi:hypothetical protein
VRVKIISEGKNNFRKKRQPKKNKKKILSERRRGRLYSLTLSK